MKLRLMFAAMLLALHCLSPRARASDPWIAFPGGEGPGKGKHIVLVSGDEEYRSEEGLPQLAKILSSHHGFRCTVLFAIDSKGEIDPKTLTNIPGLQALDSADLMIILTRYRALPVEQMQHIDNFLKAGKPVIGLRTATHAFNDLKGEFAKYNNGYAGPEKEWTDGFGRLVLGERWVSHHGAHKDESTRAIFAPDAKGSPMLNGIGDGEIWGASDVYSVRLPMPEGTKVLLLGQVLKRKGEKKNDGLFGLSPQDEPLKPGEGTVTGKNANKAGAPADKNNPMMPIAWTKSYQVPGGKAGRSFTTTMGAATDLESEALRRLIVNATYDLLGMPVAEKANVELVQPYQPSAFGFGGFKSGKKPADYQ